MIILDPKLDSASEIFTADYTDILESGETINSAVWSSTPVNGSDSSASSMILGAPTISGSLVSQMIQGGKAGTTYNILCLASTSTGQKLPKYAQLLVTSIAGAQ